MTSPPSDPPAQAGNEATADQHTVARNQGDAYADATGADHAPVARSGATAADWVNAAARTADDPRARTPHDARGIPFTGRV
ncbi:hypothetical protein [Actinoplanes sp. NPDC026623]|uniref:hypothetical protein n=1 Tax=Actinoplanes sp. NPDC026623 TaxID=3155610 RepID=UPI0033D1452E